MELIPGLPDDIARNCLIRIPYKSFVKASIVCKRWKSEIESVQFHKLRKLNDLSRAIIVLSQAELSRGSEDSLKPPAMPVYRLTVYEPETGVWERLPPVPGYSKGLPLFCQCAGVGRSLVVIGGWRPTTWEVSKTVHVFDFISGTWKRGANMPGTSRSFFACAADSERKMVFVAGGHDGEKNALRSALAYDVKNDKWIPLPDMERERDECKGIFHGGKFHVIGGYCSEMQGRFEGSAEIFDVDTWQWDPIKDDVLATGVCPKACVPDEGGDIYNFSGDYARVSKGETWKEVIEMPTDIRVGTMVVRWQDKVMVIGSIQYGGPNCCYVLEDALENGNWRKVDNPEEFMGHVQNGCSLEI